MQNLHDHMVSKRRKWIIVLACGIIALAVIWQFSRDHEPSYQGHSLSQWLARYSQPRFDETQAAVREIGTNALPYLLEWIDYETPAWRMALRQNLPSFTPEYEAVENWLEGEASRRAKLAWLGFLLLGTNAVSAIPELEALMKDTTKTESSARAIAALGSIGESAIPVLKAAFADSNRSDRLNIVFAFRWMPGNKKTNAWLPFMLGAVNDHDRSVRFAATNVLEKFAPEVLTNAPAR